MSASLNGTPRRRLGGGRDLAAVKEPTAPGGAHEPVMRGPASPQGLWSVPAPPPARTLWRRFAPVPSPPWWVGVHGGAGETTMATLVPGSVAAGHAWPCPEDPLASVVSVFLIARTHASGLIAARDSLAEWAAGVVPGVHLLGLVLVADAPGTLPRPLRELADVVAGGAPRTWRIPWVEQWRLGEPIHDTPLSRPLRRVLTELTELAELTHQTQQSSQMHPSAQYHQRKEHP
jgi:hypothetical protein